jgi:hypothetical protein
VSDATITSARITIVWDYVGDRVTFRAGDIERPGDGAAWSKGLTGPVRWGT